MDFTFHEIVLEIYSKSQTRENLEDGYQFISFICC